MKTPLIAAGIIALAFLPKFDLIPNAEAQATPEPVTEQSAFGWDLPTLNADGTPLTDLAGYIISVAADTADLSDPAQSALKSVQVPLADANCTGGRCRIVPVGLFAELPSNFVCRIWIQAYDTSNNVSVFSAPTPPYRIDRDVPQAPTNFGREDPPPLVVVNVNINVDGSRVVVRADDGEPVANGG